MRMLRASSFCEKWSREAVVGARGKGTREEVLSHKWPLWAAGVQSCWVLREPAWSRHLGVIPPSGNRRAGVGVATSPWLTAAPRMYSSPALQVCHRLTEQVPRAREEPSGRKTQGSSMVAGVHWSGKLDGMWVGHSSICFKTHLLVATLYPPHNLRTSFSLHRVN